jgi:hypothetical protein
MSPGHPSPLGPAAGRPVFVPTGRVGDRGIVVFVAPVEMLANDSRGLLTRQERKGRG